MSFEALLCKESRGAAQSPAEPEFVVIFAVTLSMISPNLGTMISEVARLEYRVIVFVVRHFRGECHFRSTVSVRSIGIERYCENYVAQNIKDVGN
jgi:hypothetical protein